jgi:hypothetical protein
MFQGPAYLQVILLPFSDVAFRGMLTLTLSGWFYYLLFAPIFYIEHAAVDVRYGSHADLHKRTVFTLLLVAGIAGAQGVFFSQYFIELVEIVSPFVVQVAVICGWVYFRFCQIKKIPLT